MMQSYIDEKYMVYFFESLMKISGSFSNEEDKRREMLKFFKGKTDVFLDSDFYAIIEKIDKPYQNVISNLINQFTTGRNGTNIYSNQNNKFRNLKNVDLYSKFKYPFASFWLGNKYNHTTEKYSHKNPYYFLTPEDDLSKWESFSKTKDFYVGPKTDRNDLDVLSSWDQITKFTHSFKDIIINDRYCFTNAIGIKNNIVPLIKALTEGNSHLGNILIFTYPDKLYQGSIEDTHRLLKEHLSNEDIEANIGIYASFKTEKLRRILTNNVFIKSDDSFDYFNTNGNYKTNGTGLSIIPIFNANKSELNNFITYLKNIYSTSGAKIFYGTKTRNILDMI